MSDEFELRYRGNTKVSGCVEVINMDNVIRIEAGYTPHPDEKQYYSTKISNEDKVSMVLLLLLYMLQGIPMGLASSLPLLLKEKGASYEDLSLFALVSLPFSLKLLWAPIVDTCYITAFGRRKTWLVPIQVITGFAMIIGSYYIDTWLNGNGTTMNIRTLTTYFFCLYFLMASQDIAVDGWALTMLSKENVGYASICNTLGQSVGYFLANQGFIALADPLWSHRYLGYQNNETVITLSSFMNFWGYVFIVITVIVCAIKTEKPCDKGDEPGTFVEVYRQILSIIKLKPVKLLIWILLTCKMAYAPADAAMNYKLQEYGMPKADIALYSPILFIVGLLLPVVSSNLVSTRPMDTFLYSIPLKMITALLIWVIIQVTPHFYNAKAADGSGPNMVFFVPLVIVATLHEVAGKFIFTSCMSFFSKVSDPTIGGTYMTLLNTIANIGYLWPNSLTLWLLPKVTYHACYSSVEIQIYLGDSVYGVCNEMNCNIAGGVCGKLIDGFTVQTFAATVIGIVWLTLSLSTLRSIQQYSISEWRINNIENETKSN